jgi:hypothetical protein
MSRKTYSKLLQRAKDFYFKLGSIPCPTLNDQLVVFNRLGFRHFLRNKDGIRPIKDQIRRFSLLLDHVFEVVSSSQTEAAFSSKGERCNDISFYTLTKEMEGGVFIKVVVRKNAKSIFHFISIMDY